MREHSGLREVEFVNGAVDRVDLNGSGNVESGLLESQTETACARKQVDSDRTGCLGHLFPSRHLLSSFIVQESHNLVQDSLGAPDLALPNGKY